MSGVGGQSAEQAQVAALLHAEHLAEFRPLRLPEWVDDFLVADCGNCNRWAGYALAAGMALPPGQPS